MISQQLQPIQPGLDITLPEILEAFAFTYLAAYNAEAILPRPNQAFTRAWRPTQIIRIPKVNGGRPGGVVALWTDVSPQRCLIAIDGINSLNQIGSLMDSIAPTSRPGLSGYVASIYANNADSFYDAMMANGVISNFLTTRNHLCTFAGHSMGAAMAELIACKLKLAMPGKPCRLIKFAAPRVGNQDWIDQRDRRIKTATCYNEKDPIHWFPWFARNSIFNSPGNPFQRLVVYRRESVIKRFTKTKGYLSYYEQEPPLSHVRHASGYLGDPLAPNWWPDHLLDSYRLTLMNYAAADPDSLQWRFNYLEFNNENNWQVMFRPGLPLSAFTKVVLDPAPPDAGPPSSSAMNLEAMYEGDTGGTSEGGDWGGNEDPAGPSNDMPFRGLPIVTSALLPQRRARLR